MIDDDAEYEQRRQIRAQADADVASFIASLDQDEGTGVPPPPTIKVSEVSSQPVELDLLGFGQQGSGAAPSGTGGGTGGEPLLWACCVPDDNCSEMTSEDCASAGGTWMPGQTCDDDPCDGACCTDGSCVEVEEIDCGFDFQGIGTVCDPNPCPAACCVGGDCSLQTEQDCSDMDGEWFIGETCDPSPCAPTGVCCVGTDCSITTEADCTGTWFPDLHSCDPSPCDASCCGEVPFADGMGGFWTTVSYPCDGSGPIYSGATTVGATFRKYTQTAGDLCDPMNEECSGYCGTLPTPCIPPGPPDPPVVLICSITHFYDPMSGCSEIDDPPDFCHYECLRALTQTVSDQCS